MRSPKGVPGAQALRVIELLKLKAGDRVLDVGCGVGEHSVAFALAGMAVTAVDADRSPLEAAAARARAAGAAASFFEVDARQMPFNDEFDAVVSLYPGAFGAMGDDDSLVLRRMAEAARPGAGVLATTLNAYSAAMDPGMVATLDADRGTIAEPSAPPREGTGRTSVFTPRELRLLAIGVGLIPERVWSVTPGDYATVRPDRSRPELMMVARRPPAGGRG